MRMLPRVRSLCILLALVVVGCDDDHGSRTASDSTPPRRVEDLALQAGPDSSLLTWTAPGDDGVGGRAAEYDVRYAAAVLLEEEWQDATPLLAPSPKWAGESESLWVSAMPAGAWHIGLRAADEVPNWSAISNQVVLSVADQEPPGRVTDLRAGLVTMRSVVLTWTAPGDDGAVGRALAYDLRYSEDPITDETWESALPALDLPAPAASGAAEEHVIGDLESGRTYYFAVKAIDAAGNIAELSNVLERVTAYIQRLTRSTSPYGALDPAWSPDGQRILFRASWDRTEWYIYEYYVMNADGSSPVRLTFSGTLFSVWGGCWGPDGQEVAFVGEETMHTEIEVMVAAAGAARRQVSHFNGAYHLLDLAWSPDGSAFAFVHRPGLEPDTFVYTVPCGGGTPVLLADGQYTLTVAYSPDNTYIAYDSRSGSSQDIWKVPAGGGSPVKVTDDAWNNSFPAWSPDSRWLAFVSNRGGGHDIWLAAPDGSDPVQLTFNAMERLYFLSWAPDGSRIAFTTTIDGADDICVLILE